MIVHPFEPIWSYDSQKLILGSFPSVKSREENFYYGNPKNRFWHILSDIFGTEIPTDTSAKTQLVISNKLALWDVIRSCDITGSSDSSIKNVITNDICELINKSKITDIYTNGKTADKYYKKYIEPNIGIKAVCLPSTSPANAICTYDILLNKWRIITA